MKKIMLIFVFVMALFSIVKTETVFLDFPLMGKVIYLDAGHGGVDSGARYKDILEKDINLSLVLKLEEELSKKGAIVYLTRKTDTDLALKNADFRKRSDLKTRAELINNSDCNLFLSIHLNSYPSSKWSGAQVFYTNRNNKNEVLASILEQTLNPKRKEQEIRNMYMYDRIDKLGILIEAGFLSNQMDRENLMNNEYQTKFVRKIVDGVIKYFIVN